MLLVMFKYRVIGRLVGGIGSVVLCCIVMVLSGSIGRCYEYFVLFDGKYWKYLWNELFVRIELCISIL